MHLPLVPRSRVVLVMSAASRVLPAVFLCGCVAAAGERGASRARFERRDGGCRVVAPGAATGQPALAGCVRAHVAIQRLFGRAAPAGVVLVAAASDSAPDADALRLPSERWGLAIAESDASDERELGDGRRLSATGYVAHESAHRIATALLFPDDTMPRPPAGYGSPLPDWMDEALALRAEPAGDQQARLSLLFDGSVIYALPLRRFLYMTHPALAGALPGSQLRRSFYSQALAFARYIEDRAQADGLRRLVEQVRGGTPQGVALTSLPGLPRDGGALEQAWLSWLRSHRDQMERPSGAPRPPLGTARPGRGR